jgi:phosphopantothenoylcysteine decarboxylase/phosphopantothenate--cysteine ligase
MNEQPHPSKQIVSTEGSELAGRKIVLCITGSVAAYRAVDMARLLMRHGAEVFAVMTESTSSQLLSSEMMKWATGNSVVTKLTGELEHIRLADYDMSDLVLVYPCTANTIGKAANGIDDTPVTSVLSVALGSKIPIIIAPAMHQAMHENPQIRRNIESLERRVTFVNPTISEGKAKVAEPEQVLRAVILTLSKGLLQGKRLIVTAGSTIEYIDPIRVITNLSTGRMGVSIAEEAKKLGAEVTLVLGHSAVEPINSLARTVRVNTGKEMLAAVKAELTSRKYDIAIMAAAVADFTPVKKSEKKLETRKGKITVELAATRKIVDEVRRLSKKTVLVTFKADHNVDSRILVNKAFQKLKESDADLVAANDVGRVSKLAGADKNEIYVVDRKKNVTHLALADKNSVARKLLEIAAKINSKSDSNDF